MNRRVWKQGERYYFGFYTQGRHHKGRHYMLQCGIYKMRMKFSFEI